MNIIIAGAGKVGGTVAEHLSQEGHSVTIVDMADKTLERLSNQLDVMCVKGNCASRDLLLEAGARDCDVLIAATASDEINLLCCHCAHNIGVPYTVARVRGTEYANDLDTLKRDLGITMLINPEFASSVEISRLLRFPSAANIDTFARGRVELSQVCEGCVMSFEPLAFEAGLVLESSVAPGVGVTGDGEELRRLCAILLDNACKYCGPGGTVRVTLEGGGEAALTVHNTGEPIPAEDQAHLFERFYRADAARGREKGGYGLGLSIAAAIVERHGGKIAVRSTAGEGTAFTVTLPQEKGG